MNEQEQLIYNELISKCNFNDRQKRFIKLGLDEGLDVRWYAKPEFRHFQMEQIILGLEKGIDVSLYAKPEYNTAQMEQIRWGLTEGFDVSMCHYMLLLNLMMNKCNKYVGV